MEPRESETFTSHPQKFEECCREHSQMTTAFVFLSWDRSPTHKATQSIHHPTALFPNHVTSATSKPELVQEPTM